MKAAPLARIRLRTRLLTLLLATITLSAVLLPDAAMAAPASKSSRTRRAAPRRNTQSINSPAVRRSRAIEYVRRAAILFEKGDYKKTVTLCRQAADWYPTYARSYIWMGAAYQKLRNYKEARSAYKWVIALAPNSPDATRARRGLKEIGYSDF